MFGMALLVAWGFHYCGMSWDTALLVQTLWICVLTHANQDKDEP
jgi:hypothetical protein